MLVLFGNNAFGTGEKKGNGTLDRRIGFHFTVVRQSPGSSFPACNPHECSHSCHCSVDPEEEE